MMGVCYMVCRVLREEEEEQCVVTVRCQRQPDIFQHTSQPKRCVCVLDAAGKQPYRVLFLDTLRSTEWS